MAKKEAKTKPKKAKMKEMKVELDQINMAKIVVTVGGKTLLSDKFPESAMKQIMIKQTGQAKGNKKRTRNIKQETKDAIHTLPNGKPGFPVAGFKRGMMDCTSFVGDKFFSKKLIQGAVKIVNGVDGLVPLKYRKQTTLQHNIGHNIKFSPQFHDWSADLEILYDANNISASDIVTLLNYAGFYVGVGAWRPKCRDGGSGEFGMYEVKKKK